MSLAAVIGGTGLTRLEGLEVREHRSVATPWGAPSGPVLLGQLADRPVAFLARHGPDHTIAPHEVNYRANLWALKEVGVGDVIAVNAVGGIREDLGPGRLCVPDQVIDYTWGRPQTFFEGADRPVRHADFTGPYSVRLREALLAAGRRAGLDMADGGTYGATQGPRLESAAEIRRMARDGCDMVGMTGMPEAALARELELEYACCAVVVNRAAGLGGDILAELEACLEEGMSAVRRVLEAVFSGESAA